MAKIKVTGADITVIQIENLKSNGKNKRNRYRHNDYSD